MSELEFLHALHVELMRHRELRPEAMRHELFQTSTIEALLGGAFDGDVALAEILQHGDLGLGTLNGLDGELIVIDGQAWKANPDCTLVRAPSSSKTPYAVVVPFSPGPPVALRGPLQFGALGQAVGHRLEGTSSPVAVRIDGSFEHVRVRSVPKQRHPYPALAEALAQQRISDLDRRVGDDGRLRLSGRARRHRDDRLAPAFRQRRPRPRRTRARLRAASREPLTSTTRPSSRSSSRRRSRSPTTAAPSIRTRCDGSRATANRR